MEANCADQRAIIDTFGSPESWLAAFRKPRQLVNYIAGLRRSLRAPEELHYLRVSMDYAKQGLIRLSPIPELQPVCFNHSFPHSEQACSRYHNIIVPFTSPRSQFIERRLMGAPRHGMNDQNGDKNDLGVRPGTANSKVFSL
jgi:hypothetical protein